MSTSSHADHLAVCDTVYSYASAIDRRDWSLYRSLFGDEIEVDFSTFNGQQPSKMETDVWASGVRARLSGLESTHHMMSNPQVQTNDDHAVCMMYMRAMHVVDTSDSGWFEIGGYYTIRLARGAERWLLRSLHLTVLWRRGDPQVMARGRARAGAADWV
jgi:3-phenylpropionate/cinnamic acid dioxygenase small subunit